jgi:hypothetical protein
MKNKEKFMRILISGFRSFGHSCAIILFPALYLLLAQVAVAEPDTALRFLMNEPVSMLDWGFKNIEDHLTRNQEVLTANEKELLKKAVSVSVDYDWSRDAIRISIGLCLSEKMQKTPMTLADVKEHVIFIVRYLRGGLTMNPYDAFFRHKGFRHREAPEDLGNQLSAVTELTVTVRDKDSNILSMCRAPLMGDTIEWMMIGKP